MATSSSPFQSHSQGDEDIAAPNPFQKGAVSRCALGGSPVNEEAFSMNTGGLTRRTDPLRKGCFASMNWRSSVQAPGEGTRPSAMELVGRVPPRGAASLISLSTPGEGTRPSAMWLGLNERVLSSLGDAKKAGVQTRRLTGTSRVNRKLVGYRTGILGIRVPRFRPALAASRLCGLSDSRSLALSGDGEAIGCGGACGTGFCRPGRGWSFTGDETQRSRAGLSSGGPPGLGPRIGDRAWGQCSCPSRRLRAGSNCCVGPPCTDIPNSASFNAS